jgi:hypothetical protein
MAVKKNWMRFKRPSRNSKKYTNKNLSLIRNT